MLAAALLPLCGCVGVVREMKAPPFPYAVMHQSRVVGLEMTVPNQAGDAVLKVRIGFVSDAVHLLPCATNKVYIPAVANSFKLGSEVSFSPTTTIVEDLTTGWDGDKPPPPRFQHMFSKEPPALKGIK